MRVMILTHNAERHYWFCNSIIDSTGWVVGVITGAKRSPRTAASRKKRYQAENLRYALRNRFLNLVYRGAGQRLKEEKSAAEEAVFGESQLTFERQHRRLLLADVAPGSSVNDAAYVEMIRKAQPDVIVVMGTCLLRKKIIESAPYVLNIHTGLSPYYRGGLSNFWPILEDDYGYFGVTVHQISLGIDSGDIVHTARPEVRADDNYPSINARCIQMGAGLMTLALKDLEKGTMRSIKQWTKGKLFFDRYYNHSFAQKYFQKRDAFIAEYCRRAAAGELSDVRLITNGR